MYNHALWTYIQCYIKTITQKAKDYEKKGKTVMVNTSNVYLFKYISYKIIHLIWDTMK